MDRNASFGGKLGRVVHGEYDVSYSAWTILKERSFQLDQAAFFITTRFNLVINAKAPPIDATLFTR